MFYLYLDGEKFSGPHDTPVAAADRIQTPESSQQASLWEVVDFTDSSEGVILSRVAALPSIVGWLTVPLDPALGVPSPD